MTFRLIFLLLLPIELLGQSNNEIELKETKRTDSIELNKTWKTFLSAVESKNNRTIKSLSLRTISCDMCRNDDPTSEALVPIDTFINQTNKNFLSSALYRAIKNRGVSYSTRTIRDYQPKNISKTNQRDLTLYEIWVITYVANEWEKGHEGQSHSFQFVKIKNDFKFYGLMSVP